MKIYLALPSSGLLISSLNQVKYPNILCSFAYKNAVNHIDYEMKQLTLDSGAFTAWNSGGSVDIDEYAQYCLDWMKKVPHLRAVNLDVIPGEAGRTSTQYERELGMKESLKNADYLRSKGLSVEEVFHQDEPFEFLDLLVQRLPKGQVLCISPRNDVSKKQRLAWLQKVLAHLVKTVGKDNLPKMHGLAVTSKDLMLAFPFYSVDSSTYINAARFGVTHDYDGSGIKTSDVLGFNVKNTTDQAGAMRQMILMSVDYYQRMEAMVTTTWKRRGISWEEQ